MEYLNKYNNKSCKKNDNLECDETTKQRSLPYVGELLFLAFVILFLAFVKFFVLPCVLRSTSENTAYIVLGGEEC